MRLDCNGAAPALEDRYEGLRWRALCGAAEDRPAGYGLLMRRGVLAWMRTCATCSPPVESAPEVSNTQAGEMLAPGVEAELVQVLTALILSHPLQRPPQAIRANR